VVERAVAGDPQEPSGERSLALLVSGDRADQLGEHVLGDVLGLVAVADDALDIALHVIGVADVEEVEGADVALSGAGDPMPDDGITGIRRDIELQTRTDSQGQAKVAMSLPCDGLAMVLSPV
jgi:hypothetical protein